MYAVELLSVLREDDREGECMNRYRKKPIVVEAIQYTGDNYEDLLKFAPDNIGFVNITSNNNTVLWQTFVTLKTRDNVLEVNISDYVIKDEDGDYQVCKEDVFEKSYDLIDGKQKLPNTECPICHGILEDEYKHTFFADLHTMGCFKCGYTTTFKDQANMDQTNVEKIYKQRVDMLPDVIRDMHRYRKAKENDPEAVAELDSLFANNNISSKDYMGCIRILAYASDKEEKE